MIKNRAGQYVTAKLINKADGELVTTGSGDVYVLGDNGTQNQGLNPVPEHKGQGTWIYEPTQAETNYDHVTYTFTHTDAVSVDVQVYPVSLPYYADIKFLKDVSQDEYYVNWFGGDEPLSSGDVSNPALSVYNKDGSLFITDQILNYVDGFGVFHYEETSNIQASGEAYLIAASGNIDGETREWRKWVGIDLFA